MLFFNSDIGGGFATANGGQDNRRTAFLSYFNDSPGQYHDRNTSADYTSLKKAAADLYDNQGVRDVNEVKSRLGL